MTDETTTSASSSLFGWTSPGRTLALIIVGTLFGALVGAALLTGTIGLPGPDPATATASRTGLVQGR